MKNEMKIKMSFSFNIFKIFIIYPLPNVCNSWAEFILPRSYFYELFSNKILKKHEDYYCIMNVPKFIRASLPPRRVWNSFVVLQKSTHNFSSSVPPNLSLHVDLSKCYFLVCSYEVGAENSNNFNTLFEIYSEI